MNDSSCGAVGSNQVELGENKPARAPHPPPACPATQLVPFRLTKSKDETFTYAFCCNETVTNHGTESTESMEPTEPKTGVGKYVRFHQNHGFHLESAVITERQESLKKGISSCQARWGWDLNIQLVCMPSFLVCP